jgi:hypothetical protein
LRNVRLSRRPELADLLIEGRHLSISHLNQLQQQGE